MYEFLLRRYAGTCPHRDGTHGTALRWQSDLISAQFHEYGIPCGDGHSHIVIHYCPWCAKPLLPASLRERWVDELIAMGYADPLFDETIPEAYKTDRWWRERA